MQPAFGPGIEDPLRLFSVVPPETLQFLVILKLFSGVADGLQRAILGKDLRRFGDQGLAISGEFGGTVDGHSASHAVAKGDEFPEAKLFVNDGEVALGLVRNEIDGQLIVTRGRVSESEAVVGNSGPLRAYAQCGREATPQFDATHRIMKEHDWRLPLLRRRGPDTGEDASLGMINPDVLGNGGRL